MVANPRLAVAIEKSLQRCAQILIVAIAVLLIAACSQKMVFLDGEPVTSGYVEQWGNYLDEAFSYLSAANGTMEGALDSGVVSPQTMKTYLDVLAGPAAIALHGARESLIAYEQTPSQDIFAHTQNQLAVAARLVSQVVTYAAQYGLIELK